MYFRLTAIGVLLAGLGVLGPGTRDSEAPVPMNAQNGTTYLVEPEESLGSAMGRGAVLTARPAQTAGEQGACVPEPMEDKPEGSVACKCYEHTHCKGNESHECKRHCRKDLCQCCDI